MRIGPLTAVCHTDWRCGSIGVNGRWRWRPCLSWRLGRTWRFPWRLKVRVERDESAPAVVWIDFPGGDLLFQLTGPWGMAPDAYCYTLPNGDCITENCPLHPKVHCWEDGGGSTCMLLDGHDGPHDFTPDNEIGVKFD